MKVDISKLDQGQFKTHKTVSVKEIMDAGGPDKFGNDGKSTNEAIIKSFQTSPPFEPFTDDEWADLLIQMANDK